MDSLQARRQCGLNMNPTSIEVGDIVERCGREVVRFVGTIHGDVRVFKGDGATLYYDQFRTEVRWFGEQGDESSDDKSTNDFPFNVVRVARDMEGKKMHLIFFAEHDDFAGDFDEMDVLDEADDELDGTEELEPEPDHGHPEEPHSEERKE
jgi:hypothetical protein